MIEWTVETLAVIGATFLLAGIVKGVVGLGLPTVALSLLTLLIGLKEAIAIVLVPALVTNVWQAVSGGAFRSLMRRLWPLLLFSCLGIWLGAWFLTTADASLVSGVLGVLLCLYAAHGLATPPLPRPGAHETWLSPLVGGTTGLLAGLTGSYVIPAIPFLQALGLPRDALVQAMGIAFTVATIALGLAFTGNGLIDAELGLASAGAILPAVVGMGLGQSVRARLPEERFRQVLLASLAGLGLYLAARAFL